MEGGCVDNAEERLASRSIRSALVAHSQLRSSNTHHTHARTHKHTHTHTYATVYLWEVEHLSAHFSATSTAPNAMSNGVAYNKLIGSDETIIADIKQSPTTAPHSRAYVRAGPRKELHFDPKKVTAAIVTCGGLCPGLNNVIRELTNSLHHLYGVERVLGVRGGYAGEL